MQHAKFVYSDSPQPCTSLTFVRASKSRARSADSGADDTMRHLSAGTLSALSLTCSSGGSSVGTTLATVAPDARTHSAHANGSNFSTNARWPCVVSAVISPNPNACA